jgi:hypothetical protein
MISPRRTFCRYNHSHGIRIGGKSQPQTAQTDPLRRRQEGSNPEGGYPGAGRPFYQTIVLLVLEFAALCLN